MRLKGRVLDPEDEVEDEDQRTESDGKEPTKPEDDDGSYDGSEDGDDGITPEDETDPEAEAETDEEPEAVGGDGDSGEVPDDGQDSEEPVEGDGTENDEDDKIRRPVKSRVLPTEKSVSTENKDEVTIVDSDVLFEMIGEGLSKAVEPILEALTKATELFKVQYDSLTKAINEQAEMIETLSKGVEPLAKSIEDLKAVEVINKAVADESAKTDPAPKSADVPGAVDVLTKATDTESNPFVTDLGHIRTLWSRAQDLQARTLQAGSAKTILTANDAVAINDAHLTKARALEIAAACEKIEKSLGL